jgi:hypothetical protein
MKYKIKKKKLKKKIMQINKIVKFHKIKLKKEKKMKMRMKKKKRNLIIIILNF